MPFQQVAKHHSPPKLSAYGKKRAYNFLYVEGECNFYSAESLPRVCNDVNKVHTVTLRDRFVVKSPTLRHTYLVEIRLPKKVSALYLQDNF